VPIETEDDVQTIEYQVTGMTCEHCERAVTEEVSQVNGVDELAVSATDGVLSITTAAGVDDALVLAAVEEAGYTATRR
jgi:copper chaperone CopZ